MEEEIKAATSLAVNSYCLQAIVLLLLKVATIAGHPLFHSTIEGRGCCR
jgi:hypothetical protein